MRVLTRWQSSCRSRLQSLQSQAEEEATSRFPGAVADILLFFGSSGLDSSFSAGVPSSLSPWASFKGAHSMASVREQVRVEAEAGSEARVWKLIRRQHSPLGLLSACYTKLLGLCLT